MDQVEGEKTAQKARQKPNYVLPTERITFSKQLGLLRAYGTLGEAGTPVSLKDASAMVGLNPTTATLANGFFVANGLLQKADGGRLVPGPETIAYARAHQWNPETAARKLEPALAGQWHYTTLVPRLKYASMSQEQAISVLAETAAAGPSFKAQLKMILEYLEAVGAVVDEGGTYSAGRPSADPTPAKAEPRNPSGESHSPRGANVGTALTQTADGAVQFHVSVKVEMSEFAGWQADRIASFFSGIAQVLAAKGAIEKGVSGNKSEK